MTDKFSNISTLVDLLRFRVNKHPDRVAYTFLPDGEGNGISLTYAELDKKARSIAVELQRSYHRGSRAILAYPSGLDFICAFFGCVYAGIIAVPAYPPKRNQKLDRFKSIIDDSKPSVILSKSNIVNKIKPMYKEDLSLKDLPWVSTETISEDNAKDYWENLVNADDIVFLQYTSGSTAKPKGVMITHENIIYNELMLQSAINLSEDSIAVGWSPLFHDMGLIGQVLSPIYMGMRLYFMAPISFLQKPICWIKAVSDYKATVTLAPNFAYELCARQITDEQKQGLNLSHLKIALSGSEPVNSSTMDRFYEAFSPYGLKRETLYPAYGLAEVTLFATGGERGDLQVYKSLLTNELERNRVVLTGNEGNNGKGTKILVGNGKPWLDEKIVIADPETNATKPVGEIGEILISGKNVAKGYWNNPEATKQTFQAYLSDTGDGPFLRTGDSGFIFNGSLFVTGRIKDMIIIRGQNYYPQDIEWTVDEISFDVNGTRPIRVGACGAFSTEVNGEEKLIVAIEVNSGYLTGLRDILKDRESIAGNACSVHQKTSNKTSQSHGDADVLPPEVIADAIGTAVAEEHELYVYYDR
ncbi:MAG: fatty acyl-AMP ligase [Nitrospirae bacterium]|nr:fatty acyl-AMP ligase [Nitrospirota bacterium]